ncbi:MAG: tetratricopeptide repeat protein [Chthoniobacteraceae bacterium]
MRRRISFVLPVAAGAMLSVSAPAQTEPLKPFRPGQPPAGEAPAGVPLKPFRPGTSEEIPKAAPVKRPDGSPAEPEVPRAIPVRKPTPPAPGAVAPPVPVPDPVARPVPPREMPAGSRAPSATIPEPGDIVVGRPGTASTADQVQLQYADGFYARKMWRDAAPEYERYLDQFVRAPAEDRQAAYYRLAECYRQTGAINNAKTNYEAILSNFTAGEFLGYAAYRAASIYYEEKNYRDALQHYRRASVRLTQPTLVYASRFYVGRCYDAIGQPAEARQQYEDLAKVTDNNPFRDASRLSVGRILGDAEQREPALKWLLPLSVETTNPEIKAEALARSGLLQLDLGQPDTAAATFDSAMKLKEIAPWKDTIEVAQYQILYKKKDYKGVVARFKETAAAGLRIESKLNVLVIVADSQRELGQRDEAMASYAQIVREFPATRQARDAGYARLVMLYEGNDQRLLEEVNTFLTDNPTAPQVERVSLMKAEALFKAGDFEHAAPIYQVVVAKTKGLTANYRGEATFKLGWCWVQLGRLEEAVTTFTTFLGEFKSHPKVPSALAQRGSAFMQLRRYVDAQKDFIALTATYPKAKEREFGLENLALIHGQLGDQAKMAESFELLLRDYPETAARAKAHYWIGRAAFDAKDYKKAAPHLDEARKRDKAQFFERGSLAIMACHYNLENADAVEKEIEFYKANGGKAETPGDVIRWLGQRAFAQGQFERAEKYLPQLVLRKEAVGDDFLLLARSRSKLGRFKEAVDSFDSYLASAKDPVPRVAGMIEKADAQLGLKDWDGAEKTVKEGLSLATEGRYNGELRLRAGEVEAGRGNMKKALQIFETIPVTLEDEEVSPRALDRALAIEVQLGNAAEVKRLENQLRTKYPEYLQKKKNPANP